MLRNLSIEKVAIENVDEDYSKVAEKFYQGLLAWSRGTQRATTKKLCEALYLAGCSEALEKLSSMLIEIEIEIEIIQLYNSSSYI